jgi:hypothetical protein
MTMLRHRYRWRRSSARIMRVGVSRIGAIGQQRRDKEAQGVECLMHRLSGSVSRRSRRTTCDSMHKKEDHRDQT